MAWTIQTLAAACIAGFAVAALAGEPVNSKCPISGNSFDEPGATVEVDGHTVGFCCPGCVAPFEEWSAEKQAKFVQTSLGAAQEGEAAPEKIGDPFTLANCPIGGDEIGAMGEPVIKEYAGREVRFCCDACIEPFEEDLAASWAKVDAKVVKDQTPYYPLETCLSCATELDAEDCTPVDFVYRNRLFRACSDGCKEAVLKAPVPAWKKLDAAVVQAQKPHYPIETCVVSDEELGSMGKPRDVVVANRLVRLCCKGCGDGIEENPASVIAKVDQAWEDKYGEEWPDISIHSVKEMKEAAAGS